MNISGQVTTPVGQVDLDMTERWFEAVILTIVALTALIGNISLWLIITRSKRLRSNSNMFILCLSGADILVSAVNMPVIVYTIVSGKWEFSHAACVVLGFITMLTFVASVMSLGAISFNRYFMICHPGKYKSVYTRRNTLLIIGGVWLLSAMLALPPLVGWGMYDYLPGQSVCFCKWTTSISYTFFMVFVCFGGPCSVMTFSYVNILREVRKSKQKIEGASPFKKASIKRSESTTDTSDIPSETTISSTNDVVNTTLAKENNNNININMGSNSNLQLDRNPSYKIANNACDSLKEKRSSQKSRISFPKITPVRGRAKSLNLNESNASILQHQKRERRRQEELRLTTSFLVVIFCFIICWLPFCITMFWSVFSPTPVPRIPDMITILLGCTNSCLNPIIYGIMNRNFREGFRKLYCNCWRGWLCFPRVDNSQSSTGMSSSV